MTGLGGAPAPEHLTPQFALGSGHQLRLLQHPQAHAPGWRPDTRHWSIQVRRRLPLAIYFWELAHELAEYLLTIVEPYEGEDRESYANALAASLLLPEEVMRPHLGLLDLAVADELHVDPACYALRWGEQLAGGARL